MTRPWMHGVLPLILVASLVATFLAWRPLDYLTAGAPPVEELVFEQVRLDTGGMQVRVRAAGTKPVRVAQVQVDDAYWTFTQTPKGPIGRFDTARLDIPYQWVEGEAHVLKVITATGATFEHEIEVASRAAGARDKGFSGLTLIGLFIGPLPVLIGLLFYPALARAGDATVTFVLGITVGLLAFLLIDTVAEGLEVADRALDSLGGATLFWGPALAALLGLFAFARRGGASPGPVALAVLIALGIGLHNLGEGLAVGAAISTGEVALASYLVLGFALHNITEGVGIAAPLMRARPRLVLFAGLTALAGLPAVAGTLAGAYAYAPHWVAVCFGLGAGAIAQVIVEVSGLIVRRLDTPYGLVQPASAAGIAAGMVTMYVTSLLFAA